MICASFGARSVASPTLKEKPPGPDPGEGTCDLLLFIVPLFSSLYVIARPTHPTIAPMILMAKGFRFSRTRLHFPKRKPCNEG